MKPDMRKLPKPSRLRREMLPNGGYQKVPAYTVEEMDAFARESVTAAQRHDCDAVDRLLRGLGLDPERCRTEGGELNVGRTLSLLKDDCTNRCPTSVSDGVQMPEEPPAGALGVLIGYDSLENINDDDRETLSNRARLRWKALRKACSDSKPAGDTV